jgi:hypothetical protein
LLAPLDSTQVIGLSGNERTTLTLDEAMNWTRPVLKKIAMLADPPHDNLDEDGDVLKDNMGFPLAPAQADGTEQGVRDSTLFHR